MAAVLAAALLGFAAGLIVAPRGGEDGGRAQSTAPAAAGEATPVPEPPDAGTRVEETPGELAIGITEPNPAFVHPDVRAPGRFEPWRRDLQRLAPDLYRLVLDWPSLDGDLAAGQGGCMRQLEPCAPFAGLRTQLEALAAAQARGGWDTLVVVTGTPERYARPSSGCERAGTEPRSRTLTERGLRAYRAFLADVQAEAERAGARLRYWSPWNEPNHPYFLAPQRRRCSADAPNAVSGPYARMARAMREELRDGQELVLGELAGLLERKSGYVSVREFIGALPRELVCATRVFGQHGYVGGPDPVDDAVRALRRFECPRSHAIWITETGVRTPAGDRRAARRACRAMRRRLVRWYEDPRVTAAFQYTLREDDRFPTGLVSVDLQRAHATLAEWVAWGRRDGPQAPPPRSRC